MTRLYLKLFLPVVLLFTAAILLIHLQPYDDTELRAFLTPPDGCPAPCFMGIRPGVTTADEAEQILKAHPWIKYVPPRPRDTTYTIEFIWNGKQPRWIDRNVSTGIAISDGKVIRISLFLDIPLGEFRLIYGQPDWSTLSQNLTNKAFYYSAAYWNSSVGILISDTCPRSDRWNLPFMMVWYAPEDLQELKKVPGKHQSPNAITLKC
jgi:hypothetical protein